MVDLAKSGKSDSGGRLRYPITLRNGGLVGGWAVTLASWALCGVLLVVQMLQGGSLATFGRLLVTLALIAVAGWWLGAFSRLTINKDVVTVVNPLRTTQFSRRTITDVSEIGLVKFAVTASGVTRKVSSWGAPSSARPRVTGAMGPKWGRPTANPEISRIYTVGPVRELLDADVERNDRSDTGDAMQMKSHWNATLLGVLLVLTLANVAIWFR